MKGVEADAVPGHPPECRGVDLAADHIGEPEPDIIEQHDEDVRRIRVDPAGFLTPVMRGVGQCVTDGACRWRAGEGQD